MATDFPKSDVVNVTITRETIRPSRDGFGTHNIVGSGAVIDQRERVRYYSSQTDVATDWATNSQEYKAANAGFSQSPRPKRVAISRAFAANAAPFLETGAITATAAQFALVSDGSFQLVLDTESIVNVPAIDFTGAATLAAVAAIIETEVQALAGAYAAVTVVYDAVKNVFRITSGTSISTSLVEVLQAGTSGTDVSGPSYMNGLVNVGRVVDVHIFSDLTGEMDAIVAANDDWYTFSLTRDLHSLANNQEMAAWAESRTTLFMAFDGETNNLDAQSTGDLAYQLQNSTYARSMMWWGPDTTEYPEVSFISRMLTVDFSIPNDASTGKFKVLPGISLPTMSTSQKKALLDKNGNVFLLLGGVPATVEGTMAVGEFFDIMHGVDWMEDAIATAVYGAIYSESRKVPYTNAGSALLETAVIRILREAQRAGFIAPDETDPVTGAFIPGFNISTVPVKDVDPSQRALRIAPAITFDARLAGAIHFVNIAGTVAP